jgi:hypothetical protein
MECYPSWQSKLDYEENNLYNYNLTVFCAEIEIVLTIFLVLLLVGSQN